MPATITSRSTICAPLCRAIRYATLALLLALISACGGSDGDGSEPPTEPDPPATDNGDNDDDTPRDDGNGDDDEDNGNGDDGAGTDNGDANGDDDSVDITPPEGLELREDLRLATNQSEAMGRVPVEGLREDESPEDFYVQFWVVSGDIQGLEDDGEARILPLLRVDGEDFVVAPLLDEEGAEVEMQITDGAQGSELQPLQIDALPPARDGALATLEQAIEDTLRKTTEAMGKQYPDEWEHWRDHDLNGMPEYLFPMMTTWLQFFDPENDDAWINQSFDEETRVLLERMLAQSPMIEAFLGQADFMASGDSALSQAPEIGAAGIASQQHTQGAQSTQMLQSTQSSTDWELESIIQITDAYDLQEWVGYYQSARRAQRNIELFNDTVGAYVSMVATVGSLPAGGTGGTVITAQRRAAMEAFTNTASAMANASGLSMWFLPCCEFGMEVTLDPEDGVIADEDEPENQIALGTAVGHIQSEGVDLTRQLVGGVVGQLGELSDQGINNIAEQYLGNVTTAFIDDWGSSAAVDSFMNQFPEGAEMIFHWTGIDLVTDDPHQWLIAEPDTFGGGTPIVEQATETGADMEFALVAPAAFFREDSQIRFRTDYEAIEADAAVDTTEVLLNHIEVSFDPARIELDGDEEGPIPFKVIVENTRLIAPDDNFIERPLELDRDDMGEVEFVLATEDNEVYFEYHPPEELPAGDQILEISTQSLSDDGIRGDAAAPIRGNSLFVTTEAPDFEVSPQVVCLEEGEQQEFEARDPDTDLPVEVNWSASDGSIDSSGHFTAPGGDTEVAITAEQPETGTSRSATVTQGPCACSWNASLGGIAADAEAGEGTTMALGMGDDGYDLIQIQSGGSGAVDPSTDTFMIFNLESELSFNEEGPTTVLATPRRVSALLGTQFSLRYFVEVPSGVEEHELPPLTVVIEERQMIEGAPSSNAVQLSGQISGTVRPGLQSTFSELDIAFSGSFANEGGGRLGCVPLQ